MANSCFPICLVLAMHQQHRPVDEAEISQERADLLDCAVRAGSYEDPYEDFYY